MSLIARFRKLYEHEKDSNLKMLSMLDSVPESGRGDARFQRAVSIAGHLAACRENWLVFMTGDGRDMVAWYDEACDFATLRPRFAALEQRWTDYLAGLDDTQVVQPFSFSENGGVWSVPTDAQIEQLFGHASYHRGQIALLVDQLGGEVVDTDYITWAFPEGA